MGRKQMKEKHFRMNQSAHPSVQAGAASLGSAKKEPEERSNDTLDQWVLLRRIPSEQIKMIWPNNLGFSCVRN